MDREPKTSTSTFTQLLISNTIHFKFSVAHRDYMKDC